MMSRLLHTVLSVVLCAAAPAFAQEPTQPYQIVSITDFYCPELNLQTDNDYEVIVRYYDRQDKELYGWDSRGSIVEILPSASSACGNWKVLAKLETNKHFQGVLAAQVNASEGDRFFRVISIKLGGRYYSSLEDVETPEGLPKLVVDKTFIRIWDNLSSGYIRQPAFPEPKNAVPPGSRSSSQPRNFDPEDYDDY